MKKYFKLTIKWIFRIILAIVIAALAWAMLIQEFILTSPKIPDAVYCAVNDENNVISVIRLHKNKAIEVYALALENGKIVSGSKMEGNGDYRAYNRYIGDYYFTSDWILPIKRFDTEGQPGAVTFNVDSAVAIKFDTMESADATLNVSKKFDGVRFTYLVEDDAFCIDGLWMTKVDAVPEEYVSYLELLDKEADYYQ